MIGAIASIIFCDVRFEINLIVISEKTITKKPIKNVTILSFWYLGFSLEIIINMKGIRDKTGI